MDSVPLILEITFLLFSFQMVALNFNRILLMLVDQGSIPWETLQSQDGLNLGDVHFCPIRQTLHMQCISLDHLQKLIAEGAFMHPHQRALPSSVGLLQFSWSSRQMANMRGSQTSMWGSLFAGSSPACILQILDFIKDIEVDLKAAHDTLKARGNPSKRHAFRFFVSNYGVPCPSPQTSLTALFTPQAT